MAASLRIHRLAQQEIDKSLRWYAVHSIFTAIRLRDAIRSSLETILSSPDSWPVFHHSARGFKVKGFPYIMVYAIESETVYLIAFQHASRRPGYWKRRRID